MHQQHMQYGTLELGAVAGAEELLDERLPQQKTRVRLADLPHSAPRLISLC